MNTKRSLSLVLFNPVQRMYLACLAIDILIVVSAASCYMLAASYLSGDDALPSAWTITLTAGAVLTQAALFYLAGLYDFRAPFEGLASVVVLVSLVLAANLALYGALTRTGPQTALLSVFYAPVAAPALMAWRRRYFGTPFLALRKKRVVVLGTDDCALRVVREMEKYTVDVFDLAAVFDYEHAGGPDRSHVVFRGADVPVIDDLARLREILRDWRKTDLVVFSTRPATPGTCKLDVFSGLPLLDDKASRLNELNSIILDAKLEGADVVDAATFYKQIKLKVPIDMTSANWFVLNHEIMVNKSAASLVIKRAVDVILASTLLVALAPLMLVTALMVRIDSGGPVLFSQTRLGYRKRPFRLYKFRSMSGGPGSSADKTGGADSKRITRVGRFIRATHLDEMPQLVNILKGDMSFIGPRPMNKLLEETLRQEIPFYTLRYYVRPGLSGWAVVMYGGPRCPEAYREYLEYDLFYIQHFSFILDLIIFLKTIKAAFTRFGVKLSSDGASTLGAAATAAKRLENE